MSKLMALSAAVLVLLLVSGCACRSADLPGRIVSVPMARVAKPMPVVFLAPARTPRSGAQEQECLVGGLHLFEGIPFCDEDEGLWVAFPASVGATIFFVCGAAVGLPAVPFLLPFQGREAFMVVCYPGTGFAWVGAVIVGAPSWLIGQIVWVGPRAFGRFLNLAFRSPKGQVDCLVAMLVRLHKKGFNNKYDEHQRLQALEKLERLTGQHFGLAAEWAAWWESNRFQFDREMRPIRTATGPHPAVAQPYELSTGLYQTRLYQEEGWFVEGPAFAGGVICVPVFIIYEVIAERPDTALLYLQDAYKMGYAAVGGVFWLVKQICWDCPWAFGRWVNLTARSPKGKVDCLVRRLAEIDAWYRQHPGEVSKKRNALLVATVRKLEDLTVNRMESWLDWPEWWAAHHHEFDKKMRRIKPAREPAPKPPAAPAPTPTPAPEPAPTPAPAGQGA